MKTKIHKFGTPTYIIKTYYKTKDGNMKVSYLELQKLSIAKKIYKDKVDLYGIENVTFMTTKQIMLIKENGDFVGMERPF